LLLNHVAALSKARAWSQDKTPVSGKSVEESKKVEIPVDPTPRLGYQYGQAGRNKCGHDAAL
jgi:hypothetical protein